MDIAVSIVTDKLSKLVDAAIHEASYPFRVNKYVKELEAEKDNLQLKIQGVQDRANEAKKNTHKVAGDVEKWLKEAYSLMAKVVELEKETKNRNKTSCLKYCPNLIKRYNLAKQLEEKTNEISKHSKIEFPQFSRRATLVGMNYYSADFIPFDSRQEAYDLLLEALKDNDVHMIGLYGIGGCGKTTMAKEVGKEAKRFYSKVIFVAVSTTVEVRKIQGEIASQLDNLKLEEEEEPGRARRLSMRLRSGERFLIILDDVWEMLNFEAIGIPLVENQKGCTALITTRKLHVCQLMNCKRVIPLKELNEDEAWILFQKHVGTFDESSNFLKVLAQEITKECGGLPVAIAAVASSLKGKSQVEWNDALETLRDSTLVDIEKGLRNPYACLQLSYDNLENEVAKSVFLLCAVFPEDAEIWTDQLSIIGMGLGLVEEVHSYQRARNQVIIKGIYKLIDSCLLQDVIGKKRVVKMHDLIRDVALWIAKKENKLIMGQERSQKDFQEDMVMENNTVRYLWIDKIDKFLPNLECSELEFLYISTKSKHLIDATNDFLNGMRKLRVLFLENTSQENGTLRWPKSDQLINNLYCLFLKGWNLVDMSFIENLERLESLILEDCCFDELPKIIIGHRNLRLLEVRDCKIQKNPYEVIGRCSQLKVLYFLHNNGDWIAQGKKGVEFFDEISVTPTLESYCIQLAKDAGGFYRQDFPITRSLCVEDFETCISNATIKDLMQRAEVLYLGGIKGTYKSVIPDVFQTIGGDMHALTQLGLLHSNHIEYMIDPTIHLDPVGIFSKLTHLTIEGMKHLKSLCKGQAPLGLYATLEFLRISKCDSFKHIIADEVKEIVADDSEYQRSYRFAFPKLKSLFIDECNQLEYLMPISFAQNIAQLASLQIWGAPKLKSVFSQSVYEYPNPNMFQIIQFSALRDLSLSVLPNIVSICPQNYHPTWPSLESLTLHNCPQLNPVSINDWIGRCGLRQEDDMIASEDLLKVAVNPLETLQLLVVGGNKMEVIFNGEGLLNNGQQVNSTLVRFHLFDLPELRHIWRGPRNFLLLQHLRWLDINNCGNLKVIFTVSIVRSLPQLGSLSISKCKELEEIIGDDQGEEENQNGSSNSHQPVFPNLNSISIYECHKLKHVFPVPACGMLPKLRVLWIEEASEVEQVFGVGDHEKEKTLIERNQNNINVIPNLEYAILLKLPTLTPQNKYWIDWQSVRYLISQQCPRLPLTSTVTPQHLLQIVDSEEVDWETYWALKDRLEHIIKSNDDCSRESIEEIDSKEREVESELKSGHITSGAQNNEQKLTENAKESRDQNAQQTNTLDGKGAKGSIAGSSTENAGIVISSSDSQPPSSLLGSSLTSLPKVFPPLVKELKDQSAEKEAENGIKWRVEDSISENAKLVTSSSHVEPARSLLSSSVASVPRPVPHDVKERFEGSAYEIARGVPPSTQSKLTSSLPEILVTSLPKKLPHEQITPIINLQDFEDNVGQLPIASVPVVANTEDELVAMALEDLKVCLKMPLKDIATSEPNSLRLLTALNILSCLSFEDGALSHGLQAMIQLLLKDFPNILYSFKPAFATIKFVNEVQEKEARLKEQVIMLEKEIQDCEAKISSLPEQKEKRIVEIKEFKKEYESVRKEKSEMVEDQRKAQQQLLEVYYRWSVLCSQFQQNHIDAHGHQIIRSALEDNNESNKDCSRETNKQIQSKETKVQAASESERLSSQSVKEPEDRRAQEETILKENDIKGSVEGSTSDNAELVISSTHSKLASSSLSSPVTSLPKAVAHEQIKVNQTEIKIEANPVIKLQDFEEVQLVAKAFVDLEVCLKMPLKDIATSEPDSLRFLTALNFLSNLSFEEESLSHGLKAIIRSLLHGFPSIIYSFKPAFATFNKFCRLLTEAQEKEAKLKEQILMMEKEIQDCEAKLSSLQERKNKCAAETIELKKEFDNVRKERSEMVGDQQKAQQQLVQANHKWSVLRSQFQLNNIAAKNLS